MNPTKTPIKGDYKSSEIKYSLSWSGRDFWRNRWTVKIDCGLLIIATNIFYTSRQQSRRADIIPFLYKFHRVVFDID